MARKTVRPKKKGRSAKQRANDKRLGAMARARARGGSSKRKSSRGGGTTTVVVAAAAPRKAPRKKQSSARKTPKKKSSRRRSTPRGMRFGGSGGIVNQAIGMAKDGAIMGVGALAIDVAMGQVNKFLPTGWDTPMDGTEVNHKNAAVKAALSVGIGYVGQRFLPASMRQMALKAAVGALTIQAYTVAKGTLGTYLPDSMPLGYVPMPRQQMRGPAVPMIPLSVSPQGTTMNGGRSSFAGAPLNKQAYYTPYYGR